MKAMFINDSGVNSEMLKTAMFIFALVGLEFWVCWLLVRLYVCMYIYIYNKNKKRKNTNNNDDMHTKLSGRSATGSCGQACTAYRYIYIYIYI